MIQTADDFLEQSPDSARELGRTVGAELQCLHQAVDQTGFDNFADPPGSERTYGSWSAYLEDFLAIYADFIQEVGIDDDQIDGVRGLMRACPFVAEGRFLHGDVTIRNVGVYSYRPITVGLFDPSSLSGDPSWDIAPMMNNVAFNEIRNRSEAEAPGGTCAGPRTTGWILGVLSRQDFRELLMTAQLMQALLQAEVRQDRLQRDETDTIDVDVTHEFIGSLVNRMAT